MSEADQDHRAIPGTVTVALGSFDQLFDFALGQMLTRSQLAVRTQGPFSTKSETYTESPSAAN